MSLIYEINFYAILHNLQKITCYSIKPLFNTDIVIGTRGNTERTQGTEAENTRGGGCKSGVGFFFRGGSVVW